MLSLFQTMGLLTHLLVFALGVGGLTGAVPLARGRRAGLGLVLMAASMGVVIMEPQWHLGVVGAGLYTVGFLVALWLVLGPERRG